MFTFEYVDKLQYSQHMFINEATSYLNFDFSSSQRIQKEKELSDSSANIETVKTLLQPFQLRQSWNHLQNVVL